MKVCKFGGTSLASARQIKKAADIVMSDPQRQLIVVSAPGKRFPEDDKITDLLISLSNAIISGYDGHYEAEAVARRYRDIGTDLGLSEDFGQLVTADLQARINRYRQDNNALTEALKAAGEDLSARLVAAYFNSIHVPATYINPQTAGLLLYKENGQTSVLPQSYTRLRELRQQSGLLIFPGFFGYDESGRIVTFSRGGSDITGSILAAAVEAEVYENWTDVDSVYAVNPSLVHDPKALSELTYLEMRELAYAGFTVLHEDAIAPAFQSHIPVNIRNTNNPEARGTMIVEHHISFDSIVTGIAGSSGFTLLHFSKFLMNREVGFALKVLQILADYQIPFEHMPSGIDSISLVMRSYAFPPEKEALVCRRLREELGVEDIRVDRNIGIVMIVGEAMAQTVGVTSRAVGALSRAGINLELIIQGASEISVIFGVRDVFTNYAIKVLYKEFFF
ncbi:aspartate kinase [Oscillospiraceae bacterium HV4-5-C5C]|nr:aspartate kinase [Oscillospiraceae bacterium HV4-5-C5C]